MEESLNYIELNENYRIRTDVLNIILQKKTPKRKGIGKNAEIIPNEYNYQDVGYFGSLEHLAGSLIKTEVIKAINEVDSLEKVITYIKDVERSIKKHLDEKVVLHK